MSTEAITWVFDHVDGLAPEQRWLLTAIAQHMGDDRLATMRRDDLARAYGRAVTSTREQVDRLVGLGRLVVARAERKPSTYGLPGFTHPARLQDLQAVDLPRPQAVDRLKAARAQNVAQAVDLPSLRRPTASALRDAPLARVTYLHPNTRTHA